MNRFQSLVPTTDFSLSGIDIEVGSPGPQKSRTTTAHALFGPMHYESNYAYPLLVWLHGAGQDESQLKRIMPQVSMRNYVAVAPRGLMRPTSKDPQNFRWSQSTGNVVFAEQQVFDAIQIAARSYHVAPHRVFLAGADCGGTMAFRIAMQHPERFAGVVSLGGPFPIGRAPLAQLSAIRRLPLFVTCNRASSRYGSQHVCDNLRLFHTAGMSVTLREYPGGDELTPMILADVDRWIMEQITAPAAQPVDR